MKYFTLLPKITYDNDLYSIRNLSYKYYFSENIDDKYLTTYKISDNESLESICFKLYNDTSIWWLIAILNDIRDVIFDMPLNEDSLQNLCRNISVDELGDLDVDLYATNYDLITTENDEKRTIRVVKSEFIQKILTEIIRQV